MVMRNLVVSAFAYQKKKFFSTDTVLYASHRLNCAGALIKADESKSFSELVAQPVTSLQGIGPVHSEQLEALKIKKVSDLANYKYYLRARAFVTLAETEEGNGRMEDSIMNVDKAVDKAFETATLNEIVDQPVSALYGLTDDAATTWKQLGVLTIRDLASYKYCQWAEAMLVASTCEDAPN